MSEELDSGGGESNGVVRVKGPGILTREEFHARERAAFLAGEGMDDDQDSAPAKPAKPPAPKKKPEADVDEDDDLGDDLDDEDEDHREVELDGADDAEEDDDAELDDDDLDLDDLDDEEPTKTKRKDADPETEKRTAHLRKLEQRMRAGLERDRAAFERERTAFERDRDTHKAELAELAEFRQLKSRARYNLSSVLAKLGFSDDDYEPAARELYALSKAGASDPKNREAAARLQREREHGDELSTTRKELAELKKKLEERDQQTSAQRETEAYLGDVMRFAKRVADKTPLVRNVMKKNPERARSEMSAIALDILKDTGKVPSAKQVVVAYEKARRRDLREQGVDVKALIGVRAIDTKTNGAGATTKNGKASPSGSNGAKPLSGRELRDDILKNLEDGTLD